MLTVRRVLFASVVLMALGLAACLMEDDSLLVTESSALRRPVSASLHGWTIYSSIERATGAGNVRGSVTFDDNGSGGVRSGGVCLLADLRLGACDVVQDCLDAAAAAGLPGNGGDPGWWHYCEAVGRETRIGHLRPRRCWSRPGTQGDFCSLGPGNAAGANRFVERTVTDIPLLPPRPRRWTALSCLAGGFGPDGARVGDPLGCALLSDYVYALDVPLTVVAH